MGLRRKCWRGEDYIYVYVLCWSSRPVFSPARYLVFSCIYSRSWIWVLILQTFLDVSVLHLRGHSEPSLPSARIPHESSVPILPLAAGGPCCHVDDPLGISRLGVGDLSDSGFYVDTSLFPYIFCCPRWESVDHRTQERSRSPGICWPLFTPTLPKSVSLTCWSPEAAKGPVPLHGVYRRQRDGQTEKQPLFLCSPSPRLTCSKPVDILLSPSCLLYPSYNTNINPAGLGGQPVQAPLAGDSESLKESSRQFKQTHFREVFGLKHTPNSLHTRHPPPVSPVFCECRIGFSWLHLSIPTFDVNIWGRRVIIHPWLLNLSTFSWDFICIPSASYPEFNGCSFNLKHKYQNAPGISESRVRSRGVWSRGSRRLR